MNCPNCRIRLTAFGWLRCSRCGTCLLFAGLFRERTDSNVPIDVNGSGTTSVNIHEVRKAKMQKKTEEVDIFWTNCAKCSPESPGTYLCYEPNIGPPPDFQFLRWDMDRGWRDDNDNKAFPTHWAKLTKPDARPYSCSVCGLTWQEEKKCFLADRA